MARSNDSAAEVLQEFADLVAISGGDPYWVRAKGKAACAVAGYPQDLQRLDRKVMTRRLIAAIEHRYVNIIGHPTTRSLGRRPPIDFDVDAVFAAAVRTGTALEMNSFPDRLDLSDELARRARETAWCSPSTPTRMGSHTWRTSASASPPLSGAG